MPERRGEAKRLGILVGGGPAPGINGVIAAATIEAINNGLQVIGLYDGYQHIVAGDISQVTELTIADPRPNAGVNRARLLPLGRANSRHCGAVPTVTRTSS